MSKGSHPGAFSPAVSQNFLTGAQTIQRLLQQTTLSPADHVIEIGAGKGHITRALLAACRSVDAYEIDPALCGHLRRTLGHAPGLSIRQQDFLRATLPGRGAYKVFANIPFCITTPILRKLAAAPNPPREAWLLVERGAALRFAGLPRHTPASLSLHAIYDVRIACRLSRRHFHPMPSVDVALLHLCRKAPSDLPAAQLDAFAAFARGCRAHGIARYLTKKQTATALRRANLEPLPLSAEMRYVQWLCLFRCYAGLQ